MSRKAMAHWLDSQTLPLLHGYMEASQDAEKFPTYSALKPIQLRAVMKREIRGLISYVAEDQRELKEITELHKKQALAVTNKIPTEEQLLHLETRAVIVKNLLLEDPETQTFRDELLLLLENAVRFYRISTRKIEFDRKVSGLTEPS